MIQAASVPYRKGLELVAVSEGVSALLSQVRLTEYELPQGKAKSQFGIALEPVFVPEIDQAPMFTPAGGNFGTVDVGFLETFEVAVKVDRRKGATEEEKAKAWRQVAQYPTREYQEERRQAAERARGYRKIIDARKRERAQLLEVRRRYREDRAKLARLMKLEMVDEAQKASSQENLRPPMRHGYRDSKRWKHEMPPRCRPLKKQKLERQKPPKKRDWLRFHRQPTRSLGMISVTVLAVVVMSKHSL